MAVSKRILLVEDDESVARLTQKIVKDVDPSLEVVIADESEVAMELLNAGEIGLALIDGNLKDGKTGPMIARTAHGLGVPFMTTTSDSELIEAFRRYEPVAYVTKPDNMRMLEIEIRKFYSL